MARSRRSGRFSLVDLTIAALAAMIAGAVFAAVIAPVIAGSRIAAATTHQVDGFAAMIEDAFPEAYPQFLRVTYERNPEYGILPAEARFLSPASRFAVGGETGGSMGDLDARFATARPLDRAEIGRRVRAVAEQVAPEGVARCEDYTVGPERMVRWPDWPEQRVREVVIEMNVGC